MATKRLRIGTLNLQNLQLAGERMYPRSTPYTAAEYRRKVEWLAQMIARMKADVYCLQELWTPRCLHDVFDEAGLSADYKLVTTLPVDDVGNVISVAMAVKRDTGTVDGRSWIKDFPDELVLKKRRAAAPQPDYQMAVNINRFSRPVLRVKVTPTFGKQITLFVAHLKSKLPMRLDSEEYRKPTIKRHATAIGQVLSTIRRTAEAGALRVLLNKAMKDTNDPVVVVGDLNDATNSVTNAIITAEPSYRLFQKSRAGFKSDVGLYSAGMLQDLRSFRDVVYTYVHEGKQESLDHILVSEQFYDYSKKRIWSFRQMQVFNDHLDERSERELARRYSDHAAVVATFDYHPA